MASAWRRAGSCLGGFVGMLLIGAIGVSGLWAADISAATIPLAITAHTKTNVAVTKGDTLLLTVEATGEHLEPIWATGRGTICRTLTCEVDTAALPLGTQKVTFVLIDGQASLHLTYFITVLLAPPDYQTGKVSASLIQIEQAVEAVSDNDLVVRAIAGRGYSYERKKLQVIGAQPRTLAWTERLRTGKKGLLRFGRDNGEDHVLAYGSGVSLLSAESGRRVLLLNSGAIRSRNLDHSAPRWSILAGTTQIDLDEEGDVLVKMDTSEAGEPPQNEADDAAAEGAEPRKSAKVVPAGVTITVLRGAARVFVHSNPENPQSDAGTAALVRAGETLRIGAAQSSPGAALASEGADLEALIALTMPQYLSHDALKAAAGQTILGYKHPQDLRAAVAMARAAAAHLDAEIVLEALLPLVEAGELPYQGSLLVGRAYRQLLLAPQARTWLNAAALLRPTAGEPQRELGLLEMQSHHWPEATRALAAAEDLGDPERQLVAYELGVAYLENGQRLLASAAFQRSLWATTSPDLAASAQDFLATLESRSRFELRFAVGLGYDSNVLHSGNAPASVGLSSNHSVVARGAAGVSLWAVRTGRQQIGFTFDTSDLDYQVRSLHRLSVITDTLAVPVRFGFGGGNGLPYVAVDATGTAFTMGLGGVRALDELSGDVGISLPRLWQLRVGVTSARASDPQPAHDYIVDPVRWDLVTPADRSFRQRYYLVSLKPVDGGQGSLRLAVRSGTTLYVDSSAATESFRDLEPSVAAQWTLSARSSVDATGLMRLRTFTDDPNGRKDRFVSVDVGWRFVFTAALSQRVNVTGEMQKSTDGAETYRRDVAWYGLELGL